MRRLQMDVEAGKSRRSSTKHEVLGGLNIPVEPVDDAAVLAHRWLNDCREQRVQIAAVARCGVEVRNDVKAHIVLATSGRPWGEQGDHDWEARVSEELVDGHCRCPDQAASRSEPTASDDRAPGR